MATSSDIHSNIRSYQKQGIDQISKILADTRAAYLADEMGLGKTLQAIKVAEMLNCKRILIVCPASLRLTWRAEFKKWHAVDTSVWPIFKGTDAIDAIDVIADRGVVAVSYDLAATPRVLKALLSIEWDLIIFDEAHYLKNRKAKRTKACLKQLWQAGTFKLCMSGTPLPNGVIDGYTVFSAIDKRLFPSFWKYAHRYCHATKNYWGGWEFRGSKNVPELRRKLLGNFFVRRTKKQVLRELPDKIYSEILVVPADKVRTSKVLGACQISATDAERIRQAIEDGKVPSVADHVATQRRGLGLLKVPGVLEHLDYLLKTKTRLVVFAYHTLVLDRLVAELTAAEGNTVTPQLAVEKIDGSVSAKKRQVIVERFQSDDEMPMVLVGQITAMGIGLTLTAADTCVFAELDWQPATMTQAVDRLHRIGQKEIVQVHYCLGEKTMDTHIIGTLRRKMADIEKVLA